MIVTAIAEQGKRSSTSSFGEYLPALEVESPVEDSAFSVSPSFQAKIKNTTAVDVPNPVDVPLPIPARAMENESASPIQIWEGTVQSVQRNEGAMSVLLKSKMGAFPDHFADIDLEWVTPQDLDLVQPGAVFYLTLFKERRRGGTVINGQEIRFRRLPSWNKHDVASVRDKAKCLLAKGITKPEAP